MSNLYHMRRYQQQAIVSASPEQLVLKLYDLGITCCHRQDRLKLRRVLVELVSCLDFEQGGELASSLHSLYTYCLEESGTGDLDIVCDLLSGLRDAWREGVLGRRAA